ncbi:inositol polyphosphate 5-phosphatase K-like [Ylistrum balloti]|uniref:inositol polyphosphate 5-phosphatase K-like n=1 Tax=Ylistrum balloti TaxID=509963 RepID=UPI0029058B75|nr:inositol polyphosphate 5-phosphatase K-like [Ylistrum balloti]
MASSIKSHAVIPKPKIVRLYMCTWNVGTTDPPSDMTELLGLDKPYEMLPDIYGIGLQEVSTGDADAEENKWTKALTHVLGKTGFVRVKVVRMQGLLSLAFVKRGDLLSYEHIESERSKAGMGGWWGNKGGVSIRFDVNGVNLIMVNAHLAAHMNNAMERIEDFFTILDTQNFRDKDVDNILDHDYVFWMGDLNFRLDDLKRAEVEREIAAKNYSALLKNDQLLKCKEEGMIFTDFEEGPITFAPTYKFDPGTDIYDTSEKQRVPAWCDRILWMVHEDSFQNLDLSVKQFYYKSLPSYTTSDHKPVISEFQFPVFPHPPSQPVVTLQVPSTWKLGKDVDVTYMYRNNPDLTSSSWDWIGLYRNDFSTLNDYISYKYAESKVEGRDQPNITLTWKGRDLPTKPGMYVLCYISKVKDTLMGMSSEFQVVQ